MDVHASDLLTVALLVLLEGLLSIDNALVLALLVLGLPKREQKQALRYGILGAFVFRIIATLFATYMIQVGWVKLVGGAYLLYLSYKHFFAGGDPTEVRRVPAARPWLGMTAFWATVVKVELTDIVFAIDSILVAVAMSPKIWVVITGGLLGIAAMRMVTGQLVRIVERYPALVDGAFIIIAWVGIKLLVEWAHSMEYLHFEIPKWFSLGLIIIIFVASYLYARKHPAPQRPEDDAYDLLTED
ncbi:MAG: TerC family protein [Vicinamibacterales bacterium]